VSWREIATAARLQRWCAWCRWGNGGGDRSERYLPPRLTRGKPPPRPTPTVPC